MRVAHLALASLLLGACSSTDEPPAAPPPVAQTVADTSFDAADWMQRAAVVWDTTAWSASPDSALAASQRLATELNAALPWMDACDLPAGTEADTTASTGIMHRYPLGPEEDLVSISCELFANQATFVLAHVAGRRARLVEAAQFDETGALADTSTLFVGLESVDAPTRTVTVFTRARGVGDCGTLATHRIGPNGSMQTVSVRARECIDVLEDSVELPERWPVVFPRP
jgi:hypothetical protein